MANAWFRMYSEFATDPKVQALPEALQRRYVMLLCLKSNGDLDFVTQSSVTVTESVTLKIISTALRITEDEALETKNMLVAFGFITDNWDIKNWEKRQYISDLKDPTNAERQKRYREKNRNTKSNGGVTVKKRPDTDTDTEVKELDKSNSLGASASDTPTAPNLISDPIPEKQKTPKPEYPAWFENLWQHYPQRQGSNDKRKALHAAQARIKSGKTPDDLLSATHRYAEFVRANGNWGTQFVMQAATFYGPGEHIDNPWRFSHAANQQSPGAGAVQGKQPFADIVRRQAQRAIELIDREAGDSGVYTAR